MTSANVLLVEDEAIIAADLQGHLQQMGYTVLDIVNAGEEAVQVAATLQPDLILMDIGLAGAMDGIAAATAIRARHDIPVVFLTAHADPATLERAKIAEPAGYLAKPFQAPSLQSTVEMALHRQQLIQQLKESEARYHIVADNTTDWETWFSPEGLLLYCSPSCEAHTGYTAAEFMADSHLARRLICPEDLPVYDAHQHGVILAQQPGRMEFRITRRDGAVRWMEHLCRPVFDAQGVYRGVRGSNRDATERKQMEAAMAREQGHLHALIESSRDGLALFGLDEVIYVINQHALDFLRLAGSPNEWVGRHFDCLLAALPAAEIQPMIAAERARLQHGDEQPGDGEWEYGGRTLHWFNLPVQSDAHRLGRLMGLRDVTPEHQLETMRDDIIRTMVHDLRNPLTALHGALDVFEMDDTQALTEDQREMLTVMSDHTHRMLELVTSILDVSRLESGRMPLMKEPVWFPQLVDDVLRLQGPLAAQQQVSLTQDIPETLPPVYADPHLIGRVVQNLVGNALKFTPEDGTVRVTAVAEANRVRVSVRDTGPGIAPDLQSRLFQKFVAGRVPGHGSGLGLAFCRLVVEAHGGRIGVDSTPGQGSAFYFSLPVGVGP
jgi:PAS domain S-box-containing protein